MKKKLKIVLNQNSETSKICVITLTYNRPQYIERSFESLYKRAGCDFTHYVFDDCSDKETQDLLKKLRKRYKFHLFLDTVHKGLYKRFASSLRHLPDDYDYYVKFDSDVEILSDNLFKNALEIFNFPNKIISGIIPRVEGIIGFDRHSNALSFYGNHAIKIDGQVVSGCCMIFPKDVFLSFLIENRKKLVFDDKLWGVDAILYDYAKDFGTCIIIEDLSVYHIDNAYGQRRVNSEYFTKRKRWDKIDNIEVWYMLASKEIYPAFLDNAQYNKIRQDSKTLEDFLEKCKLFLSENLEKDVEKQKEEDEQKVEGSVQKAKSITVKMYRITSPLNFPSTKHMKHGTIGFFKEVPDWARNNPSVVIEQIDTDLDSISTEDENSNETDGHTDFKYGDETENQTVTINETGESTLKEDQKGEETKKIRNCKKCNYVTSSFKRMKSHKKKHD